MKKAMAFLLIIAILLGLSSAANLSVAAASGSCGNGRVNNRDLGLLQRCLNGWSVTVDTIAADLNTDGKLNNHDLALLQRLLNGWEVAE